MRRFIALIICSILAAPSFCQEITTESIPNSELHVSFPSNWNFIRPYLGNGKYSSIHVNLPKGEHGGTPAYPEFDFEFLGPESQDKRLMQLVKTNLPFFQIGGVESKVFTDKPEVRYLLMDMSHSYSTLQVTGYLVPINKGSLICTLTTQSKKENEHTKYISTLETYCASAVKSAKSPNKSKHSEL
jgi:hypothetical protein